MTHTFAVFGLREARLLRRGDLKQFGEDLNDFHIRTDNPLAMAGSLVMAPAVAVTKLGNAIGGEFSDRKAVPLGEGFLKYTTRDIQSLVGNTASAIGNLLTLRPLRAAGNAVKGALDGLDLVTDPFLDVGTGFFGHTNRQAAASAAATAA
ncbi:MAG: hypothetical protein PHE68_02505 [Candidatus Peribacteraceae bacterium]|nr:hypothetical protein [Candidatus Peribacteraceae bacterium]MDD5074308.1 hypothetical protein [Candidatus Peribacteraceae bacterium]